MFKPSFPSAKLHHSPWRSSGLSLQASTAGVSGSIPGWRTKSLHSMGHSQKKKNPQPDKACKTATVLP